MVQIKDELKMNVEKEIVSYTTELREIKADVYRSLAILASNEKVHNFSVYWWSQTLKVRLELGRPEMIRAAVDCMRGEVNASNDGKKIDLQDKKGVLAIVARIPDLLSSEKQELKKNIENNFSEDEK